MYGRFGIGTLLNNERSGYQQYTLALASTTAKVRRVLLERLYLDSRVILPDSIEYLIR